MTFFHANRPFHYPQTSPLLKMPLNRITTGGIQDGLAFGL